MGRTGFTATEFMLTIHIVERLFWKEIQERGDIMRSVTMILTTMGIMVTGIAGDTEHLEMAILHTEEMVLAITTIIAPTITEIIPLTTKIMTGHQNSIRETRMKHGARFLVEAIKH